MGIQGPLDALSCTQQICIKHLLCSALSWEPRDWGRIVPGRENGKGKDTELEMSWVGRDRRNVVSGGGASWGIYKWRDMRPGVDGTRPQAPCGHGEGFEFYS